MVLSIRESKAHQSYFFLKVLFIFVTGFLLLWIKFSKLTAKFISLDMGYPFSKSVIPLRLGNDIGTWGLGGYFSTICLFNAYERCKRNNNLIFREDWLTLSISFTYIYIFLIRLKGIAKVLKKGCHICFHFNNKGPVNQHIRYPGVFRTSLYGWTSGL